MCWVAVDELPEQFVPGPAAALGEYPRGDGVGMSLRGWAAGAQPRLGGALSEG
ncbi:MutT-family protein [Streptomyces sp. GBA 94-10 4N24]|nr:MutT-family protein [Streptomyces sp. GBA 94-10 4N24]ESQ04690.1 MutT-family protein [Streptomyces sp. PVA_94-07]UZN61208.1 MutT-family protein [Streptomyces sp. GBA 94-10 4N24]